MRNRGGHGGAGPESERGTLEARCSLHAISIFEPDFFSFPFPVRHKNGKGQYQSWSDWGKISDEYGWWLIGGGVALFLLICIGCIVLTGGDDDDGRGQKKSS